MKAIVAAAAAAAFFAAPAAAFDNTTCKDFLAGTWTFETVQGKAKINATSTYNADGTFTQVMEATAEGMPPQVMQRGGVWDAGPGSAADKCLAKVTPEGEPENSIELTVIDDDTVATPDGLQSHRVD